MKPRFLLAASLLFVLLTLAIRAGSSRFAPAVSAFEPGAESLQVPADCGGEPCDAVVRGHRAFFDRGLDGLGANGRACADCHMATSHFQLSPADVEARFRLLELRRRGDPNADDPLFRPIDADDFRVNGESAGDFSNLRQNGLVRVTLPLPPNIKLVDPVTNAPSTETFVDVWRAVPTVNDVKLTGPDGINPWPRGPNNTGGYQLDARVTTLQEQALGALINHAQIQSLPPQQLLDDLASFQRVLFTNHRIRALSNAISAGDTPLPDPDGAAERARTAGQGRVRPRLRSVPRRPDAVDAAGSCHSIPHHLQPVSPSRRYGDARSLRLCHPARTASLAMHGPTRSRCRFPRLAHRPPAVSRHVLCLPLPVSLRLRCLPAPRSAGRAPIRGARC